VTSTEPNQFARQIAAARICTTDNEPPLRYEDVP